MQEMREQMNSTNDSGEFQEVESNCSGRLSYVFSQPAMIQSSRSMLSRAKRLHVESPRFRCNEGPQVCWSAVDFGQFRLRPAFFSSSANFDFGQFLDFDFMDHKGWCPKGWGPEGWVPRRVEALKGGAPKGGGPEGVGAQRGGGPKGWGPEGVGARRGGGPEG